MLDTASDGIMNAALAVGLLTVTWVVVSGDCEIFVKTTEADVAVVVIVSEPEAAVTDTLVVSVF